MKKIFVFHFLILIEIMKFISITTQLIKIIAAIHSSDTIKMKSLH